MADESNLGGGFIDIKARDATAPGIASAKNSIVQGVKDTEAIGAKAGAQAAIEAVRGIKDLGDLTQGQIGPRSIGFISTLTSALGPLGLAFSVVSAATAAFVGWISRSNEKTEEARRSINRLTRDIEEFRTAEDPKDEFMKRFDAIGKETDAKKEAIELDKSLNKKQRDEQLKALDDARRYRESQIISIINNENTLAQEARRRKENSERGAMDRKADMELADSVRSVRDAELAGRMKLADKEDFDAQRIGLEEETANKIADLEAQKSSVVGNALVDKENAAIEKRIEAVQIAAQAELNALIKASNDRLKKMEEQGAKEGEAYAQAFWSAMERRQREYNQSLAAANDMTGVLEYTGGSGLELMMMAKREQASTVVW